MIAVRALDRRLARYEKPLRRTTEGFFKFRKERRGAEVYLVNSSQIKKLNFKYRGKNEPTDVLAVEAPGFPGGAENMIGEVYLNPASLRSKSYDIHYALIHGLLHLSGFTHKGKSDNMEMEKLEKEALKWLRLTY